MALSAATWMVFGFVFIKCAATFEGERFDPSGHHDFYEGDNNIYMAQNFDEDGQFVNDDDSYYDDGHYDKSRDAWNDDSANMFEENDLPKQRREIMSGQDSGKVKRINEKLVKHGIKPRKVKANKASQKPKLPIMHTNKQQPTSPTHTKRPSQTKKESINKGKLNPHKEDQKKGKHLVNVEKEISGKKESSSKTHTRGAKLTEKETGKVEDSPRKNEQRNVDSSQQEKRETPDERKQTIDAEENVKNEPKDRTLPSADESNKGENYKLAPITDSDPEVNAILQSPTFDRIRRQQLAEYINGHFKGQKLEHQIFRQIDNLITTNLRGELKRKGSHLNIILEREGVTRKQDQKNPENQKYPEKQVPPAETKSEERMKKDSVASDHSTAQVNQDTKIIIEKADIHVSDNTKESHEKINKEHNEKQIQSVVEDSEDKKLAGKSTVKPNSKESKEIPDALSKDHADVLKLKRKNLLEHAVKGIHHHQHQQQHPKKDANLEADGDAIAENVHSKIVEETRKQDQHISTEDREADQHKQQQDTKNENEAQISTENLHKIEEEGNKVKDSSDEASSENRMEEGSDSVYKDLENNTENLAEPKASEDSLDNDEKKEGGGFFGGIMSYFSSTEETEVTSEKDEVLKENVQEIDLPDPLDGENETELTTRDDIQEKFISPESSVTIRSLKSVKESGDEVGKRNTENETDVKESIEIKETSDKERKERRLEPDEDKRTVEEGRNDSVAGPTEGEIPLTVSASHGFSPVNSEGVDLEHEKNKYRKLDLTDHAEKAPTPPTIDTSKIGRDSEQFAHLPDDEPLKKLCMKHPVLEVCQNLHKDKAERLDVDKKTRSVAWYIKTFTKTINSLFYAMFLLVVECIRTCFIRIFEYTFGLVFWLIGQQEITTKMVSLTKAATPERFTIILLVILNHIVFYWYFRNSSMQPKVRVIERNISSGSSEADQKEIMELRENVDHLETKLRNGVEKEQLLTEKVIKLEKEKEIYEKERDVIKTQLSEESQAVDRPPPSTQAFIVQPFIKIYNVVREALQSSVDKLQQSSREVEETLSTREAELKVADQTSEMLRKELEKTKAELKKTEEKFLYVIKELDTKDYKITKMEEKEKETKQKLTEAEDSVKEKEELVIEKEKKYAELMADKDSINHQLEEEKQITQSLRIEIEVLQETIVSVTSSAVDQHTSNDFETVEEDGEIEAEQLKAERLLEIMDATKLQAELKKTTEEFVNCKDDLEDITAKFTESELQRKELITKYEKLLTESKETSKLLEKKEIELSTISKFFAERESDYQKTNVTKTEEIKTLKKQLNSFGDNEMQISHLIKQIEDLKEEIINNERDSKQKISAVEEQAHSNYIKMRTALRECEEHKREKEIYRKRLLDIDVSPQFKKSTVNSVKAASERAASPTNSNKSGDDLASSESPKSVSTTGAPVPPMIGRMFPTYPRPPPPFGMPPGAMGPFPGPPGPPPYMSPMRPPPMPPRSMPPMTNGSSMDSPRPPFAAQHLPQTPVSTDQQQAHVPNVQPGQMFRPPMYGQPPAFANASMPSNLNYTPVSNKPSSANKTA